MGKILDRFPYWKKSDKQGREVKVELYKILLDAGIEYENALEITNNITRIIKGQG